MSEEHVGEALPEPTGPGTSTTAQEALKDSAAPTTVLTEEKPAETPAEKPAEIPLFSADKITFPEGFVKDDALFEKFSTLVKDLPHETAQGLSNLYADAVKAASENTYTAWKALNDQWVEEVKADREIGGTKLDEVKGIVARVLDKPELSDPKFREALNMTGAGNHPSVVRTLYKWALKLTEGAGVQGQVSTSTRPRSAAQAMYPNLPAG